MMTMIHRNAKVFIDQMFRLFDRDGNGKISFRVSLIMIKIDHHHDQNCDDDLNHDEHDHDNDCDGDQPGDCDGCQTYHSLLG